VIVCPAGKRLNFRSAGATAGPDEARRYALWFDGHCAEVGAREIRSDPHRPFAASVEYTALGIFGLGRSSGSVIRVDRRREHVSRDGIDRFVLVVNRGSSTNERHDHANAMTVLPGWAALLDFSRPSLQVCPSGYNTITLHLPRLPLLAAIRGIEDLVGTTLPAQSHALRLLCHHADAILDDAELSDPALLAQVGQHLLDLAVLAFNTDRDNAEIARHRGLRAARLAAVLRLIRAGFADPEISPAAVAARIGISARQLHALLQTTGTSFSERVQELRLQRAFELLSGAQRVTPKVSDAAYAAGFSDLSHFNRLFRRRYGMTPTAARGCRIKAR
jgi:AraC-like DNA-binding protein